MIRDMDAADSAAWDVSQDAELLVLHVTADPRDPDAVAPVAALFEAE
jgi:hypothetical protein